MESQTNLVFHEFELNRSRIEHEVRYHKTLPLCKNKDVLDIGCAARSGSKLLAAQAKSVLGIDIIPEQVKWANENMLTSNLSYKVDDVCKLSLSDSTFDVAVCLEVIEHVSDYKSAIKNIFKVLRPNGMLVLTTPNRLRSGRKEVQTLNEFHEHEFTALELKELLLTNGFEIVEMEGLAWDPKLNGKSVEIFSFIRRLDLLSVRKYLPYWLKESLGGIIKSSSGAASDQHLNEDMFNLTRDLEKTDYFWVVAKKSENSI